MMTRQDLIESFCPCAPDGCDWGRATARTEALVPDGFNIFVPLHVVRRNMGRISANTWRELVLDAEREGRICYPFGDTQYLACHFS